MKKMIYFSLTAMLILAVTLSGCGGGNSGVNPGGNNGGGGNYGKGIVFASNRNPNGTSGTISGSNIYSMNLDGTNPGALTTDTDGTVNYCPELSPDGTKVVYVKRKSSSTEIWVMNINKTNEPIQLYTTNTFGMYPSWTPTGRITFYDSTNHNLYVVNADKTNLASTYWYLVQPYSAPRVSPDNKRILVEQNGGSQIDIYDFQDNLTSVSVTTQHTVYAAVTWDGSNQSPFWSSDGSKIYFSKINYESPAYPSYSVKSTGIYWVASDNKVNINTKDPATQIFSGGNGSINALRVSSDPNKFIFSSNIGDGEEEIFSINSDGSGKRNLTNNPGYDGFY